MSWGQEVSGLLYPLFVYLYLDMVHCGLKSAVDSFYSRFQGLFLQDPEQRDIVELLRHVLTSQDVFSNPKLSAFLDQKYVVHLTEAAYSYLLRYLQSGDNGALCWVLSAHMQVEVTAVQRMGYQLYGSAPGAGSSSRGGDAAEGLAAANVTSSILQQEAAAESLQDCIKRVQEGPASLTTVCFYAFHHTERLLNAAEISADSKLLAAGFDNSCVKLWSLRARKLKAERHLVDVSRVHLACDVLDDEVRPPTPCPRFSSAGRLGNLQAF